MEELKNAIKVREKYNQMDFDIFVVLLEKYIGKEIPKENKDHFRFTGLHNVDFFNMWVD